MKYRELGKTGMMVPVLSFGASSWVECFIPYVRRMP